MDADEFAHWRAYQEIQGFGPEWEDSRFAVLSANLTAALCGKAQKLEDHIIKRAKRMTREEVARIMRTFLTGQGVLESGG